MSEGAVYRELLAYLVRQRPPNVAERDLIASLDAARSGPLAFAYGAALDAGADPATARSRAAGCFACFAAGNLADDLADGDCTYLESPIATGPAIEFVLLHAAYALWAGSGGVGARAIETASALLSRGATQQLVEVRHPKPTLELTRAFAEGMGGAQYAAYLTVALDGSTFADDASAAGLALGNAGFVAEDRRSRDPRFTGLEPSEQRALTEWARGQLALATSTFTLPALDAAVRYVAPLLEGDP